MDQARQDMYAGKQDMKTTGKCPKCGSNEVHAKAYVREQFPILVTELASPEAILLKREKKSALRAWLCTGCGYVELYVDDPQQFRQP